MAETESVRERIMEALVAHLTGMTAGEPSADPYTTTFSVVSRKPVGKLAVGKKAALGVYDPTEQKTPNTDPVTRSALRVVLEFHVFVDEGEDAAKELNRVLLDLQRRVLANRTLGGLAIDTFEVGSELDVDGAYERQVTGALFLSVDYRHHTDDPRVQV